eukprot:9290450-Ditylum_brightwellii.AAC.1
MVQRCVFLVATAAVALTAPSTVNAFAPPARHSSFVSSRAEQGTTSAPWARNTAHQMMADLSS